MEKKVLVISYGFPPAGGGGVLRTLKFVKYLPSFGWSPVVLTVQDPLWVMHDETLLSEVPENVRIVRAFSLEADRYPYVKWLSPFSASRFWKRFVRFWIDVFTFAAVPDQRVGWIPFAFLQALRAIEEEKINILYATGDPFSAHILGSLLKLYTGLPLVLDFRDEWIEYRAYAHPDRAPWKLSLERFQESKAVALADRVVAVSEGILNNFRRRYPGLEDKLVFIPNGYDDADFREAHPARNHSFTITHTGGLYRDRTPLAILTALRQLFSEEPALRKEIRLVQRGLLFEDFRKEIARWDPDGILEIHPPVSHEESISAMMASDLLLLIIDDVPISPRIYTGKVFEYLGSGKPILATAHPHIPVADLIRRAGTGVVYDHRDIAGIKEEIRRQFNHWKNGGTGITPDWGFISQYSRKALTGKLAEVLDSVM